MSAWAPPLRYGGVRGSVSLVFYQFNVRFYFNFRQCYTYIFYSYVFFIVFLFFDFLGKNVELVKQKNAPLNTVLTCMCDKNDNKLMMTTTKLAENVYDSILVFCVITFKCQDPFAVIYQKRIWREWFGVRYSSNALKLIKEVFSLKDNNSEFVFVNIFQVIGPF
jgi:hypothetical protein